MKFTLLLLAGATVFGASLYADSIPEDLKAKIEAKSKEVKPGDESAQNSWVSLQCSAWENIQYITSSLPKEELDAIKKMAEEKFPLEYSEQEKYVMKQSQAADSIEGYKPDAMKAEDFKLLRDAALKEAKNDYAAAEQLVAKQIEAYDMIAGYTKPPSVDDMTFEVTKAVAAKKFPGNYIAQYEALKKLSAPAQTAVQQNTAAANASKKAEEEKNKDPRDKNKVFYVKNAVEEFNRMGFVYDDDKNPFIAMLYMYKGKPVIILPKCAYTGSPITIKSVGGDSVTLTEFFSSNEIPVMMSMIESVPSGMIPAEALAPDKFRDMISKNLAFITARSGAPFAYTLKVASFDGAYMPTTTKIPPIYPEGSILMDEVGTRVMGVSVMQETYPEIVKWQNTEDMRMYMRQLERAVKTQKCVRIDALKTWTRMNSEKYLSEVKQIQELAELNMDAIVMLSASRYDVIDERPGPAKILAKFKEKFRQRTLKDRFEKFCRDYLLEIANTLKFGVANIKPNTFYGLTKPDMEYNLALSHALINKINDIIRTRDTLNWVPNQAKSMQERY